MKVQIFISETSIEGLYAHIVRRFTKPRKGQCNLVGVGSEIRNPVSELTAIVTKDPAENAAFTNYLCQCFDYIFTFQVRADSGSQALPRESVDHGKTPHLSSVMKLIRDKVHCPTIVDTFRRDLFKFAMKWADFSFKPLGAKLQTL